MKYIAEKLIANKVKTTINETTVMIIKMLNQSFLRPLNNVKDTLANKKTTPTFTPMKAYLIASTESKFWKNIEMINMMTNGGRMTPKVVRTAPKNPPLA